MEWRDSNFWGRNYKQVHCMSYPHFGSISRQQERKKKTSSEKRWVKKGTKQVKLQPLQLWLWPFTKTSNTNVAEFKLEKALGTSKNFTVTSEEPWQRAPKHKREKTQQRQIKSANLSRPISEKYELCSLNREARNQMAQKWHFEAMIKEFEFSEQEERKSEMEMEMEMKT